MRHIWTSTKAIPLWITRKWKIELLSLVAVYEWYQTYPGQQFNQGKRLSLVVSLYSTLLILWGHWTQARHEPLDQTAFSSRQLNEIYQSTLNDAQNHTKSNSIKALQYCVFDNPSYYFGLVKSIKKPPFSLALQTRVHCLSLCIVAKDWLVFSRMVAFFHPWKIQLSCFRFPRGCIFHLYSGNFYFCWLTSTMTKTYHLDPATPQNHFLQQVILRHLSIST